VTPQEQLFADFFKAEKEFVLTMDDLSLRAHREELAKIAFEARARLTAVDDEERDRSTKRRGKANIHQTALNTDDITSNAINTINERKKRLSKTEKLVENLMKLPGMDRATAEKMVTAGTLKAQLDEKFGKSSNNTNINENKAITVKNPFESKKEEKEIEVKISEETNTIIIEAKPKEEEKKAFVNPFVK
jgi:hypothetical protein